MLRELINAVIGSKLLQLRNFGVWLEIEVGKCFRRKCFICLLYRKKKSLKEANAYCTAVIKAIRDKARSQAQA